MPPSTRRAGRSSAVKAKSKAATAATIFVLLYLCVRHAIFRRDAQWTPRDRRVAYLGVAVTLLMGSLSTGTLKSE